MSHLTGGDAGPDCITSLVAATIIGAPRYKLHDVCMHCLCCEVVGYPTVMWIEGPGFGAHEPWVVIGHNKSVLSRLSIACSTHTLVLYHPFFLPL